MEQFFLKGHKSGVEFSEKFSPKDWISMVDEDDMVHLWGSLQGQDVITMPQSTATNMGTGWAYNSPEFDTVVEIYREDRNSYEYAGAPKSDMKVADTLGYVKIKPGGYVRNSLEKG